jgi:hypothetical protein
MKIIKTKRSALISSLSLGDTFKLPEKHLIDFVRYNNGKEDISFSANKTTIFMRVRYVECDPSPICCAVDLETGLIWVIPENFEVIPIACVVCEGAYAE